MSLKVSLTAWVYVGLDCHAVGEEELGSALAGDVDERHLPGDEGVGAGAQAVRGDEGRRGQSAGV